MHVSLGTKPKKGEHVQSKSPAEFFAENQNIAGFDNVSSIMDDSFRRWHCFLLPSHLLTRKDPLLHHIPITISKPGKSLYTTIRELVENSLDAAESIEVLPDIKVTLEEMSEKAFNEFRGMAHKERVDQGLFNRPTKVSIEWSQGGGRGGNTT